MIKRYKVFSHIQELDCFVVDKEFSAICNHLSLREWHEVVWIGRYFLLDNDFGEHWLDNWELREVAEEKAKKLGLESNQFMCIDPERFKNNADGPCHTNEERKQFWSDVFYSLELSLETLINESIKMNERRRLYNRDDFIENLQERIEELRNVVS